MKSSGLTGHLLRGPFGHLIHTCPPYGDCPPGGGYVRCIENTTPCQITVTFSGLTQVSDCSQRGSDRWLSVVPYGWTPNGLWTLDYDPPPSGSGWKHGISAWPGNNPRLNAYGSEGVPAGSSECLYNPAWSYATPAQNDEWLGVFLRATDYKIYAVVTANITFGTDGNANSGLPYVIDPLTGFSWRFFYGCIEIPGAYVDDGGGGATAAEFDCRQFAQLGPISNQYTVDGEGNSGTYCWGGDAGLASWAPWYGGTATLAVVPW